MGMGDAAAIYHAVLLPYQRYQPIIQVAHCGVSRNHHPVKACRPQPLERRWPCQGRLGRQRLPVPKLAAAAHWAAGWLELQAGHPWLQWTADLHPAAAGDGLC
jgi:hypothetical protein